MSDVWLAYDVELDRPVVLKFLAPEADRTRFEREARAAASLAHPNVTRLYDYGEAEGRLFMALEYLPGGTLEDRLADGRRLPDAETAAIASQLAAGLAHAHANGLVHRDLKPANVLFDDEGRPKLADFGIARIVGGDTITEVGTMMGTAAYISPEQAAGEPAGSASDVYSFGVLLYRMLTGRLPFESDSPYELAQMHRRVDPPPLDLLRPDAPPELASVVAGALAKDPRNRPPDGEALTAMLGAWTAGADTAAAAAAPTVVMPRARRRPRIGRLPLLIAALLVLGGAGVVAAVLVTQPASDDRPPTPTRASTTQSPTTSPSTTSPTTTPASGSTRTTTTEPHTTATAPGTSASTPMTTSVPTQSTVPTTTTLPTTVATTITTSPAGG